MTRDHFHDDAIARVLDQFTREPASDVHHVARAGIVEGYMAVADRLEKLAEHPAFLELMRRSPATALLQMAKKLREVGS